METNILKEETKEQEQQAESQEEKSLLEEFGVLSHVEYGY